MGEIPKSELMKAGGPDVTHLLQPGEQVVWQGELNNHIETNKARTIWMTTAIGFAIFLLITIMWILRASPPYVNIRDLSYIFLAIVPVAAFIGLIMADSDRRLTQSLSLMSYYWLTNRHAIIVQKHTYSSNYTTTIIDLAATDAVKMIERGDGSGTLVFGRNAVSDYSPTTRSYVSNEADYSFSDIPRVVEVYAMVQQMQAEARRGEGS